MELKDLVTLYFERTNAMESLWSIYITITLGLIGFVSAAKLNAPRLRIISILILAFVGFAAVNGSALDNVVVQRNVLVNLIRNFPTNNADKVTKAVKDDLSSTLDPTKPWELVTFHLCADVLAILAIVIIGFRESRADDSDAPGSELRGSMAKGAGSA
jgi:hypothetical protein